MSIGVPKILYNTSHPPKDGQARALVEDGYLEDVEMTLPGLFQVTIRGFRLTERGRMAVLRG